MTERVKVALLGELPPGKGKVVEVAGKEVAVFNVEGRFVATSSRRALSHGGDQAFDAMPSCAHAGRHFEVFAEDSPADQLVDDERFQVSVEGQTLWLEVH